MLEVLVRRLFADSEYRRAFIADPEGVIGEADLAPHERAALTRLSSRLASDLSSPTNAGNVAMYELPLQWE